MSKSSILHLPVMSSKSNKPNRPTSKHDVHSAPSPTNSEYFTPMSSRVDRKSPNSNFLSSDVSSRKKSENHHRQLSPKAARVHFNFSAITKSKSQSNSTLNDDIQVMPKSPDTESEVSTVVAENPNTEIDNTRETKKIKLSRRKRDKLGAVFNNKLHRKSSASISSTRNDKAMDAWHSEIVQTLSSMQRDIHEIIGGFDETEKPSTDILHPDASSGLLRAPHLSSREQQRVKVELMRMAMMLSPPNLLTYNAKQSPYPYTDIVEPINLRILRANRNAPPAENLLVQHKPFQHRRLRYRVQRAIIRLKFDWRQFKRNLYGKDPARAYFELPSLDVQNYRNRLQKVLCEFRTQIAEYDRIHLAIEQATNHPRKSISQVIIDMKAMDLDANHRIADYRAKLTPIEYVSSKKSCNLISSPFVPRRRRRDQQSVNKPDENVSIDPRFDPTTFLDLTQEAELFFGSHEPYWNQSSSSPEISPQSNSGKLACQTGVINRGPLKAKLSNEAYFDLDNAETKSVKSFSDTNENESVEF